MCSFTSPEKSRSEGMLDSTQDVTKLIDQRGKSPCDEATDTHSCFVKITINPICISLEENDFIAL